MEPTADEKLAASVFTFGLSRGCVQREDIVAWADRRIAETDVPAMWLIDLSLSRDAHVLDVLSILNRVAQGVDPVATCKAIYALLPELKGGSFDHARAYAARLYEMTADCLKFDWSQELLPITDNLADNFDFLRGGYLDSTEAEVILDVQRFVRDHRDGRIVAMLHPVRWTQIVEVEIPPPVTDTDSLIHVGLSSWIIQDGNYSDFHVGQEVKFALEFYPITLERIGTPTNSFATHSGGGRYRVQAQCIFANGDVWVINAGDFLAYVEQKNERQPGEWFEGQIYLGIDPFFYREYLHEISGMPPLVYTWLVAQISRETTPMIETRNSRGGLQISRDVGQESFLTTQKTEAWNDDERHGSYVLACRRVAGPRRA